MSGFTWLCYSALQKQKNLIAVLMTLNGVVSIGSELFLIVNGSWAMTTAGLMSYFGWNILMVMILTLIYRESVSQREKAIMT